MQFKEMSASPWDELRQLTSHENSLQTFVNVSAVPSSVPELKLTFFDAQVDALNDLIEKKFILADFA